MSPRSISEKSPPEKLPPVSFCVEEDGGHSTFLKYLRAQLLVDHRVTPLFVSSQTVSSRRVPTFVRIFRGLTGVAARVHAQYRRHGLAAAFFHTHSIVLIAALTLPRRVPIIVSTDATPALLKRELPGFYGRTHAGWPIEGLKLWINKIAYSRVKHWVTFSDWAKNSLISEYRIPESRITVNPFGIDTQLWRRPSDRADSAGLPRLLFVASEFERKGGRILLEAFKAARLFEKCELDIATPRVINTLGIPNVRVHYGMKANSDQLVRLYQAADIFVFPTLADCSPFAIYEAMSAGLPVIATKVGAVHEQVEDGKSGLLVRKGDSESLASAIGRLLVDKELRISMGINARQTAVLNFDVKTNLQRLITLIAEFANHQPSGG